MTGDDFDGAQSQPLTAPVLCPRCGVEHETRFGEVQPMCDCQPLRPQDGPAAQLQKAIPWTPEELLAWRTYMRANPPAPEPKALHRRATQWEAPQEWLRRDGAEQ